jgi:hypothetical protein
MKMEVQEENVQRAMDEIERDKDSNQVPLE